MGTSTVSIGDILLVDDQVENLKVLTALLTEHGYKVRQAINGTLAIKAARLLPPDVILLDICMPDMDGYAVCSALKADEHTQAIPVIFLSALESVADKIKAFSAGGEDYITKPFQAEEVLARVETHLSLRRMQQQLATKNLQLEQEVLERQQTQEQLREALRIKDALLKEVYHRTKNNMAAIVNLLKLQARRLPDEQMTRILQDIEYRIQAMVLVQQKLYRSEDFTNISLKDYLEELAWTIFRSMSVGVGKIILNLQIEPVMVSPDIAIPCGLLLNELLTNALKYAFPGETTGDVQIALRRTANRQIEFRVRDTGQGLPDRFDIRHTDSLGCELIIMFAEHQLQGTLDVRSDQGAEFVINFPIA